MTVASNALLLTMLNKNMAVLNRVQRLQAFWRIHSETTIGQQHRAGVPFHPVLAVFLPAQLCSSMW